MSTENSEQIAELKARLDGLQAVVGIALNLLPHDQILERLTAIERMFRAQNMSSGAIEVVRSFRQIWQSDDDAEKPETPPSSDQDRS